MIHFAVNVLVLGSTLHRHFSIHCGNIQIGLRCLFCICITFALSHIRCDMTVAPNPGAIHAVLTGSCWLKIRYGNIFLLNEAEAYQRCM